MSQLSDTIDRLYEELRELVQAPSVSENEDRYQRLLKQLYMYEEMDAERLRRLLESSGPLKPGEVDKILADADRVVKKYT